MRVCARVLAAALMTGAVAGAFTFPALFQHGREGHRLLLVPPSSQQRTLRVPALPVPLHRHVVRVSRLPVASKPGASKQRPSRPAPSFGEFAAVAIRRPKTSPARPAPPAPAPAPPAPSSPPATPPSEPATAAPAVETPRELTAEAPAPAPPAPVVVPAPLPPPDEGDDDGHGNGHAYGHDKHGDPDAAGDEGPGHGKGHAYGDDK
jgi:hypothetical protein